ncbi:hypothetical protein [Rickettsia bellii]|nr:hypothetical protein [Rickettsia bellii]ABV78743.1 hypothetical protein A1I_01785 [Rickettsia bellii OSU 85-389]KJV91424.1 hypothetical protein RBEMOGI_0025 [Rickettsia bellii str. RML Mogi]
MININLKGAKNFFKLIKNFAKPKMDNARNTAINNITKQDLEKSFKLYEKKLIELSQKFSLQAATNNDNYYPKTEWHNVEVMGADGNIVVKTIPVTEL